jgi:hypothetical protein
MTSTESYIFLAVFAVLALVALIYLLSPMSLPDDITARGAQIRTRLWDLLERHAYPDDERHTWVEGSLAVAIEHHEAISLLIDRQLTGSAFALVRSMVDTVVRAHWINLVASDEQVAQARRDDKNAFPSMSKMSEAVDKVYGENEFFKQFTSAWDAMCNTRTQAHDRLRFGSPARTCNRVTRKGRRSKFSSIRTWRCCSWRACSS